MNVVTSCEGPAVINVDLTLYNMRKIASGKVREVFEVNEHTLLFVATDRISAYDVVLANGIPKKGVLLTQLSAHWFAMIRTKLPNLQTHLISTLLPSELPIPDHIRASLSPRSMIVRRLPIIPLESIVRGYLTGSAWSEYCMSGTVHGLAMPSGLQESQKLEPPLWTPSTKAEQGQHDENISPTRAGQLIGTDLAKRVEEVSLQIYEMARDYAASCGIIIADTKFEFGRDPITNEIVLVDEVLTPDSSRFWPADQYQLGRSQASYDKQFLRDWLTSTGFKGQDRVQMPTKVLQETQRKYGEAYQKLTGKNWW